MNNNNVNNTNNANNSNNANNTNNTNNSNNLNNGSGPPLFRTLDGAVAYYQMDTMQSGDRRLVSNTVSEFASSILTIDDSTAPPAPIEGIAGVSYTGEMTAVFAGPIEAIVAAGELTIEFQLFESGNSSNERSVIRLGGNQGITINIFRDQGGMAVVMDIGEENPSVMRQFNSRNMNHIAITADDRIECPVRRI